MSSDRVMLPILSIVISSMILPITYVFAQQNNGTSIEQTLSALKEEIFWVAIGVIVAALSAIATIGFDIYDRRKQNKTQLLELVRSYGEQLADLSDKEPRLNNKKDCENYAIEYLDLMDQIAYLYEKDSIPQGVAEYFDNNFSYAKTLLIWLDDKWYPNKEKTKTKEMDLYEKNEQGELKTVPIAQEFEITWSDLMEWFKTKEVTPFDREDLPKAMQAKEYSALPDEDITNFLEVIRNYGEQLTKLMDKERNLNTTLDCEVYAMSYLDLMDQIAFLYKKKSIPDDVAEYFDNYFSYAKILLLWVRDKTGIVIDKKKPQIEIRLYSDEKAEIPQEIRAEWVDLVEWCENRKIDAADKEQLPEVMQKNLKDFKKKTIST